MYELYREIRLYLRGIWRRRWYCLVIAWVVSLAGWVWVAQLPDVYRSSARIYVDTHTMLGPLLEGLAVGPNVFEQVSIMQRTILSRPNLEKVARMTDLDLTAQTSGDLERLIENLQDDINVGSPGSNLFTISYQSADPTTSKRVVQALLTIFVEGNLGASRKDMDQAQRFIDDQISIYEAKLEEMEKSRAEFKQKNAGLLTGQGGYFETLESERKRLEKMQAALRDTVSKRDTLRKELESVPQFLELGDTNAASGQGIDFSPQTDLEVRIFELEKNLDNLLLQYTDKHPDVIMIRKRLERLRKQQQEEEIGWSPDDDVDSEGADSRPNTIRTSNAVYEQIKISLVEQESIIAILESRINEQHSQIEKLKNLVNTVPLVELELSRLNRDYSIVKRNFEELLSRRESAQMARDLETKADKVEFRIVDPPTLPIAPSGPNRLLYLSVVLAGGIGAGIAFGFVLSQIDNSFTSLSGLRDRLSFPVLGTVSEVMSPARRRIGIIEVSAFLMVCLGLLGVYGGVVAVEVYALVNVV